MGVLKPIKLKKLKKSGFEDAFFFIVVLFAMSIVVLIVYYAWNQMKDPLAESIQSSLPNNSGVNVTENFNSVTSTISLFDKLIPFLMIGLFAFVLIGAGAYMNHQVMAFVGILILGIAILLAVIYANVYHQISSTDELSSTNAQFPIMEMFMKYLPYIVVIIFVLITAAVIWSRGGAGY
jgi:uncharacterized membrane protein YidH (DUF202 family)